MFAPATRGVDTTKGANFYWIYSLANRMISSTRAQSTELRGMMVSRKVGHFFASSFITSLIRLVLVLLFVLPGEW